MKKIFWFITVIFLLSLVAHAVGDSLTELPLPSNLISLTSKEGRALLLHSEYNENYWNLARWYTTQDDPNYCTIASSVMVLNALGIPAPDSPEYGDFNIFTQQNFFTPDVLAITSPDDVSANGVKLDKLGDILRTYPIKVTTIHASDSSLEDFRKKAIETIKATNRYIIVSYLRSSLGQKSLGHASPLAAYNVSSDRFLIMDVGRYKYPPVWVKTKDLWNAMNTYYEDSDVTRGFNIISK